MVVGLGESMASIHKYCTSIADQRRVKIALRTVKTYDCFGYTGSRSADRSSCASWLRHVGLVLKESHGTMEAKKMIRVDCQ
jgi:hypothetical protein